MTKGTPASSLLIWMEQRIQALEAENEQIIRERDEAQAALQGRRDALKDALTAIEADAEKYRPFTVFHAALSGAAQTVRALMDKEPGQ